MISDLPNISPVSLALATTAQNLLDRFNTNINQSIPPKFTLKLKKKERISIFFVVKGRRVGTFILVFEVKFGGLVIKPLTLQYMDQPICVPAGPELSRTRKLIRNTIFLVFLLSWCFVELLSLVLGKGI